MMQLNLPYFFLFWLIVNYITQLAGYGIFLLGYLMNKLKIFGEVKNLQFRNDSFLIFFKIEDPRGEGFFCTFQNPFAIKYPEIMTNKYLKYKQYKI